MNEVLNKALLDLQDSLGEIDNWAELLHKNQDSAAEVMKRAASSLKHLEEVVNTIEQEVNKTFSDFKNKTDRTLEEVETLLMQYGQLVTVTAELVDYLRSVNFPTRLDKIDASVAAITQGVQNLSDKIDRAKDQLTQKVEVEQQQLRNALLEKMETHQQGLLAKIQSESEQLREQQRLLQDEVNRTQKRQDVYFGILVLVTIISLVIIVVLFLR